MARIKGGMIRVGSGKKKKKDKTTKKPGTKFTAKVAFRRAANTGEPLRAARALAGY